jgi:hypothetical protein
MRPSEVDARPIQGDPTGTNECCPGMPDGREFCITGVAGVDRCQTRDCKVEGRECATDGDCCSGKCTNKACDPGIECLPDNDPCATPEQCCSHVCAPDSQGVLRCNPGCIAEQGGCTSDADCCSGSCNSAGVCGPGIVDCIPLGGACAGSGECRDGTCDPDANTCQVELL